MNIKLQLVRAGLAVAVITGIAAAATVSPPVEADCPLARSAKPQRILLLDPVQKHPTWMDARVEPDSPPMLSSSSSSSSSSPADRGPADVTL